MQRIKKITFKNGLRLLLVREPASVAASVLILVEAGSEYETRRLSGASHFLEHLAFKGTAGRPKPGMIAEELTSLGARFNAFTTQEYTGYWAKVEKKKFADIFDIVSDLYLHPIFDPAEVEKERGVIIQEINMYEDDLPARAGKGLTRLMYGDQPAGWDVAGEKKTVQGLRRSEIMAYRAERYVPKGTVVVVAGAFDMAKVIRMAKERFTDLRGKRGPRKTPTKEGQKAPRLAVEFKESDQAHLAIGFRAFNMFDKRRYALQVFADILGGGMSSRLYKRVREELGAAYYVGAGTDLYLDHGALVVSAGVDHGKFDLVLRSILAECRRLRDEPIAPKELQRAKDHIVGRIILGLETADELAGFYGEQEILRGSLLSPGQLTDRIKAVTAEEVAHVGRAVVRNGGLNLVVVGPRRRAALLRKLLHL